MLTPTPSTPSRLSRSSTPRNSNINNRLSTPRRKSPITTPTLSSSNKRIKTALLLKYAFLFVLILLVYILLRINLQLLQRLDNTNASSVPKNDNNVGTIPSNPVTTNQLRANSKEATPTTTKEQPHVVITEQEAQLQNRLNALRNEVATMKKKVNEMKQRMVHVKDIQRSSSASVILSSSGAGVGIVGGGGGVSDKTSSSLISSNKELERYTCTPNQEALQLARLKKRFAEWWSHSACPDQVWMDQIATLLEDATSSSQSQQQQKQPFVILDIGCNKGYTSADFLDALSPGTNMNPHTLVTAIRSIAQEDNTKFDRDGGVCNDSKKALNGDRKTVRDVEVHCFEPSPATYEMLVRAHEKLMPEQQQQTDSSSGGGAKWLIHNKGLHNVNGEMKWHSACAHAVGDELCTIVDENTAAAITVPVVTVDSFLEETYPPSSSELPLVHMLKVDAEGLDPAVLTGATKILTANRAIMVMFEFNPGLSEKGDHPHGMWGRNGHPHVTLIQVTDWLDSLGYDCYLDTHLPEEKEKKKGVLDAPGLYRITGGCLSKEPSVRGWANVVCASRKYGNVASRLLELATLLQTY